MYKKFCHNTLFVAFILQHALLAFIIVWSQILLNMLAVHCIYTHTELRKFQHDGSILYVTPFLGKLLVITPVFVLGFRV